MSDLNDSEVAKVTALIEQVRGAGLTEAASMFETVYWAWLRTTSAYRYAHAVVDDRSECASGKGAMHVTTYTIGHWGPLIPGTPAVDDEAVREEYAADAAWHREEDRRMRRDAGEEI